MSLSYCSFPQKRPTKEALLEKGCLGCSGTYVPVIPDRSQLSQAQTGPLTNLPAPRACHLLRGRVGQHPGTGRCSGQCRPCLAWLPASNALSCPSRWANPQGKEALLGSSCLHSSQMGFAIKSKLNSHCFFPP